jgi:hypothetical protein
VALPAPENGEEEAASSKRKQIALIAGGILIVQVARLSALIENELRPILESTNETLGTVRGTTQFLSRNMVDPVIRVNSTFAALRRALSAFRVRRPR